MQQMDELYKQYAKTVYKFLLSKTKNADLAEELTQETFYQAIKSIDRFDKSCKVSTWLCAIAKNQLMTYLKKHPVTESIETISENTDATPSAEQNALGAMEKVELMRQLHALAEPYREIIYLRIFGNLSFREIGEIMGSTENYARVNFYRGKELLKKGMKAYGN